LTKGGMKLTKISILGAGGQIGRSITDELKGYELKLFSRKGEIGTYSSKYFSQHDHEVIINCIGISNIKGEQKSGYNIFSIHEKWDNVILDYMTKHPNTLYINMSSGAVYGILNGIEEIAPEHYYGISKLNMEAKHRSLSHLNIVDLRVFSYVSKYINLNSNFFIAEVIKAIRDKTTFVTNDVNIVRDYLHPKDLARIINLVINRWKNKKINYYFDTYSRLKITKEFLLQLLQNEYGLKIKYQDYEFHHSITGFKSDYFSTDYELGRELGYVPLFTSLDAILDTIKELT
jgi:nucleoside-diphosphate-sugar epimerase